MVEDSFEDKIEYLHQNVMMNPYMTGSDLLKCVSLLCLIVTANRQKNPDFSVQSAMEIVCADQPDNRVYLYFKERLPLICEIFLQDSTAKFPDYGLKGKDAIVAEIRELIGSWLPF